MPDIAITPPHLVSKFLSKSAHKHNTLLMDIHGSIEEDLWKAEITLIFNPLTFQRGNKQGTTELYYGNTHVTFSVNVEKNGEIKNHTTRESIKEDRKSSKKLDRNFGLALKPEAEVDVAGATAKVSPGEAVLKWKRSTEKETIYEFTEYPLDTKIEKGGVELEWNIQMPNGKPVVRAYLYGNMYLSAEVQWSNHPYQGSFTLNAPNPWFFNQEGEKLGKLQNWAMKLVAGKKIALQYPKGLTFKFEIK